MDMNAIIAQLTVERIQMQQALAQAQERIATLEAQAEAKDKDAAE